MTNSQELKQVLKAEFPTAKFSVRTTGYNGWEGETIKVKFSGADWTEVYNAQLRLFGTLAPITVTIEEVNG